MNLPLAGLTATHGGSGTALSMACELLGQLGAATEDDGSRVGAVIRLGPAGAPGASLAPLDPGLQAFAGAGIPEGTPELATARALVAGALAARMLGRPIEVDGLAVVLQVHLPAVMAASFGSDWWPAPPAPRVAPGGGWYNAELGGPDNAATFQRLMGTLPAGSDAATVAMAAQEWRLPVCDYRAPAAVPPWRAGPPPDRTRRSPTAAGPPAQGAGGRAPSLDGLRVLDLTSMWAGPLATWLLAHLGADVVKVEPAVRPDGFRALHGRGVWPAGRARKADGSESGMFNALNSNKRSLSIDAYEDGASLRRLAGSADLVVDSFSPRVMDQLDLPPTPLRLSMPAFPPGPMRDWVAYGTGVHAMSGLGSGDPAVPYRQPGVTYPDPLSGLLGAAVALAAVDARQRGAGHGSYEVSLAESLEPLVGGPRRLMPALPGAGAALLETAVERAAVAKVEDGAGVHWYPVGPLRGAHHRGVTGAPTHSEAPCEGDLPWRR